MPTYVYACTACSHQFEQYQSFSDDALTICPECAGRLRKVFNSVGLVFKGSGFYSTDKNGSGSTGNRQTASGSAASESGESSSESSSESSGASDSDSSGTSAASGSSESATSGSSASTGSSTEAA